MPRSSTEDDVQSSRRRHLLGFGAIAALALLLVGLVATNLMNARHRKDIDALHLHTFEVLLVTSQVRSALNEALRGERGYLITANEDFLPPYQESVVAAPKLLARLRTLTNDNPVQQMHAEELARRLPPYLGFLAQTIDLMRQGEATQAVGLVRTGKGRRAIEALLATLDNVEAEERRLLAVRQAASGHARFATDRAIIAMSLLALVLLLIVSGAGITASRARFRTLAAEEQLRRAATTDDLTGLLNRRAFMDALDVELERSRRSGRPMALALIDLDHFKRVNDRFGHQGGDEVLRKFAQVARQTVRTADVIGRIGGEEFALLMPETDQVESRIAAERLRSAIERRHFVTESGASVPVTISIGVAHRSDEETRDGLIGRADEALYEAKDTGRNRTLLAA